MKNEKKCGSAIVLLLGGKTMIFGAQVDIFNRPLMYKVIGYVWDSDAWCCNCPNLTFLAPSIIRTAVALHGV